MVHKDIAPTVLPPLAEMLATADVELRGCEKARAIVPMNAASAADWTEEYLGPILAIKVVDDLAVAVDISINSVQGIPTLSSLRTTATQERSFRQ
ncbi:MAG: hypothetical protein CM15mP120_25000 [Pseudomonadota bacterium]|nr:MAG: hypothetical protein CM15mP120_25000 [Pseudomonadota bacterium]